MLSVVASAAAINPAGRKKTKSTPTDIKIYNAGDYQLAAKSILTKQGSKALYEYLASGTDDEQTLSENVST